MHQICAIRAFRFLQVFIAVFMACSLSTACLANRSLAAEKHYSTLQSRLIKDGFDKKYIETLYNRPEVKLETRSVSAFSAHREATLNYDQFLSWRNLRKARKYIEKHRKALNDAERRFGVEKEIIVAVMLVETRLGTYTGGSSILNTLSTMAALSEKTVREAIWAKAAEGGNRSRAEFNKWADRKGPWAYKELKAYLSYARQNGIDPVTISGSYAGAVGIPQFMPSNIEPLAADGNSDGRIDLFEHADAIASIAKYLKNYGWKPGIDRKRKYKVLLRYNYSKYYANTLLEIADKLKG